MSDSAMPATTIRLTKIDMDGQVYYSQFAMNLMADLNAKLEQKLAEAIDVIRFYSPQGKYHGFQSNKSGEWESYPADIIGDGGKRAREFLAKLEEGKECLKI